jgi:dihydropyrimidine dehydrogenase (NAD+) subunit PreT
MPVVRRPATFTRRLAVYETRLTPTATSLASAVADELRPPLTTRAALAEADRCLFCGLPGSPAPCVTACPADVDIPAFIEALAGGDMHAAAETVFAANLLSGTSARCCPVEVLCQQACVLEREGRRPVEIGALHRHAADWGLARRRHWRPPVPPRSGSVAVIGAGPTGLVCAGELAARGYAVTVYDRHPEPGGLVRYAIAPYRQLNDPLPAEAELIAGLGARLRFGTPVDSAHALRKLEREHDAIVLAVGMGPDVRVDLPGADLPGVWSSLRFIEGVKAGRLTEVGQRVLVIGGGNTAVDVARISVRLGASDVMLVYRRGEAEMPAYPHEVAEARAEGVRCEWLTEPVRFLGGDRLTGVELRRTRLCGDVTGRPRPEPVLGTEFVLPADTAVNAIGQQPGSELFGWVDGLVLRNGRPEVDPDTGRTSNPRYYAGGDVVNGGATVVEAVRWGKLIARAIGAALEG